MNLFSIDDANFSSLRRSIFFYTALTFLIWNYNAQLLLPEWLFVDSDNKRIAISHRDIMFSLLLIQIYLCVRFVPQLSIERASLVSVNVDWLKEQGIDLSNMQSALSAFQKAMWANVKMETQQELIEELDGIRHGLYNVSRLIRTGETQALNLLGTNTSALENLVKTVKKDPELLAKLTKLGGNAETLERLLGKFGNEAAVDIERGIRARKFKFIWFDFAFPLFISLAGIGLSAFTIWLN